MRDSLGGIPIIAIVVVFIVVALGYMAFNVNYTKAFRMKNKVIEILEDYGGPEKCSSNASCRGEIKEYRESIGYSTGGKISCENSSTSFEDLFCWRKISSTESGVDEGITYSTYEISTKINVDVPVIRNFVVNLSAFYVNGQTAPIKD